jgi:hypothetical protein
MFKEPHSISTQHTTSYKEVMHRPTQASKEATPTSDKETPSDVSAHYAQEVVKGSNKRHKHRSLGTTTTTNHGNSCD